MELVQIDPVSLQFGQSLFDGEKNTFRRATDLAAGTMRGIHTELRRQESLIEFALEAAAEKQLAIAVPRDLRRIEEIDTDLDCCIQNGVGCLFMYTTRERIASQADERNL